MKKLIILTILLAVCLTGCEVNNGINGIGKDVCYMSPNGEMVYLKNVNVTLWDANRVFVEHDNIAQSITSPYIVITEHKE